MIDALRSVLGHYPPEARPVAEPVPMGNAGGLSGARIWRYPSARGLLAARAWPVDGPDRASLGAIHALLTEAAGLGFLPVPLADSGGSTIAEAGGRLWEIAPWMPGRADPGRPPAFGRVRAMFAGLAKFHARVGERRGSEGPSPGLAARVDELDRLQLGEFDGFLRAIDRAPGDPSGPLARHWVGRARSLAPGLLARLRPIAGRVVPLQPCLRDARPDHFLFEGDRLTGLIDFGAMGRESVAADLARLLAEAIGPDPAARREALAAYRSVRPLGPRDEALIEVFGRANALLGAARWVRWHFLEGRSFDDPGAVARGLRRNLDRLDEVAGGPG